MLALLVAEEFEVMVAVELVEDREGTNELQGDIIEQLVFAAEALQQLVDELALVAEDRAVLVPAANHEDGDHVSVGLARFNGLIFK